MIEIKNITFSSGSNFKMTSDVDIELKIIN